MKISIFLVICILSLFSFNAYANKALGLKIETMFELMEELYNQEKPDIDKIRSLSEDYTDDDYIFNQEMTSNLGKKVIFIEQNREEFLENIKDKHNKLSNSSITHTITDIRYLDDNKSAEVDYTALFKGTITTNRKNIGLVNIKFFSLSTCTESVRLKEDILKIYKSECKTELIYKKPEPIKK